MNELFAADPAVCGHTSELKLLLSSFGPFAGRYLANYPIDWGRRVEEQFDSIGPVEGARARTLLRRARENSTLITRNNLAWDANVDWLANAAPLLDAKPSVFAGLVASQAQPPAIHQLDELDLPPTAEERIDGTASEYARISKILLAISPEIAFVDPYLNPLKRAYSDVLQPLFSQASRGKSQKISLWARASLVIGSAHQPTVASDLIDALQQVARSAAIKAGKEIQMILVDDDACQSKMHGRYLLSIKGGIRLDQGFQRLPQGRQVDVAPVGKATHDALLDIFFDGKHDMKVVERLSFIVC